MLLFGASSDAWFGPFLRQIFSLPNLSSLPPINCFLLSIASSYLSLAPIHRMAGLLQPDDVNCGIPKLNVSYKPQKISPKFEGRWVVAFCLLIGFARGSADVVTVTEW